MSSTLFSKGSFWISLRLISGGGSIVYMRCRGTLALSSDTVSPMATGFLGDRSDLRCRGQGAGPYRFYFSACKIEYLYLSRRRRHWQIAIVIPIVHRKKPARIIIVVMLLSPIFHFSTIITSGSMTTGG